jgi:hypothetical protein
MGTPFGGYTGGLWRALCLSIVGLLSWSSLSFKAMGQTEGTHRPLLTVGDTHQNGWFTIRGGPFQSPWPGYVLSLEASSDLTNWTQVATLLRAPFEFVHAQDPIERQFYQLRAVPWTTTNDWSNQIAFPADPFFNRSDCAVEAPLQWLKFAIVLDEPHRVYFQHSLRHLLHYDFASRRLDRFLGMPPDAFQAISRRRENQQVVLGTLLAPALNIVSDFDFGTLEFPVENEYAIQFVGEDPYPPETVAHWFEVVTAAIVAPAEVTAYYMPTYEQAQSAW